MKAMPLFCAQVFLATIASGNAQQIRDRNSSVWNSIPFYDSDRTLNVVAFAHENGNRKSSPVEVSMACEIRAQLQHLLVY